MYGEDFGGEDNEVTISYTYDANGMRTGKTVTTKTYETVVVHTHSYTTTVVAPTCTEDGYTLYECDCGYSYKDNYTDALGHNYVGSGLTLVGKTCSRCGYVYGAIIPTDPSEPTIPVNSAEQPETVSSAAAVSSVAETGGNTVTERVLVSTEVKTYSYVYNGGSLTQEVITTATTTDDGTTTTTETLNFAYDASGSPISVSYGGDTYYYATNLQGDVTAILNSAGTAVVSYTYDAWGNVLTTTGSMASTLGETNPLRYRGYVYDTETGLYYLQSRYYNPAAGRFINADAFTSTGQGLLGNNMFSYYINNPVIYADFEGTMAVAMVLYDGGSNNVPTQQPSTKKISEMTYKILRL